MDIRTITATLAILGSGLTLTACKKSSSDASEVPDSQQPAGEASCGADKGHGHASCRTDVGRFFGRHGRRRGPA